jgi:hypothetical protein
MMQKIRILAKNIYQHLQNNSSLILICLIIGLCHLIYQVYQFGIWNHAIQLPILKSYFHPELYPTDRMVATRSYFTTFYFIYLGVFEKIFGHLELIFFIAYLITETLFFIAVYHLAYTIFKDRNVAIIAILLLFTEKLIVGGDLIHWNHHNHTHAVLPYILFSFTLFLKGHTRKAYGLLGFAANIHIQSVAYVIPMFALVSLINFLRDRKVTGWRNGILALLKDYGFFVIFGLPCLVWAFSKAGGPFSAEWIAQLYERSKHHSFPFSWDKKDYINYLLFATLGLLSWTIAFKNSQDRKMHLNFVWFTSVVFVLCGMAIVFAEYIPIKIVLRVQLFRSTKFLSIFTVLYSCYVIRYLMSKNSLYKILAFMTFLTVLLPGYIPFFVLLLVLYPLAEYKKLYWGVIAFVVGVLILRVHAPHVGFPAKFGLEDIIAFVTPFFEDKLRATLLALLVFWLVMKGQSKRWLKYSSAIITVLVIIVYILPATYQRFTPPYDKRGGWIAAQLWAKENTPLDAMFITPPYLQGFRIYSERGVLAEWKDGTQQYFDTEYSFIWWDRISDLGVDDNKYYDNLPKERVLELGKKYGASYIVFPATKVLDLPFVYENAEFRIYTCDKDKPEIIK